MGLPGIVALMAANNARSVISSSSRSKPERCDAAPNKYGEQYREQIIRATIRRSRPRLFGLLGLDVCPVNDAANILNVDTKNDAYRLLSAYHCVQYWNIPKEIRHRIPELIREALTP